MTVIAVDKDRCVRDGACAAVCSVGYLTSDADGLPQETADARCIECGHCVAVCPNDALRHANLNIDEFTPASGEVPAAAAMDSFLRNRRSVREFQDRPVPRQTLEDLLDVARYAPTGYNAQKAHWTVAPDRATVHSWSAEAVNGMVKMGAGGWLLDRWNQGHDWVLWGAPAALVVSAPKDHIWAKQDCAIALTFLQLAAEARGLGVCWAGILTMVAGVHAPLRELLSVPNGHIVCGGLFLGERTYTYQRVPPRKPLSAHWM